MRRRLSGFEREITIPDKCDGADFAKLSIHPILKTQGSNARLARFLLR
jgi:hypothetical protein